MVVASMPYSVRLLWIYVPNIFLFYGSHKFVYHNLFRLCYDEDSASLAAQSSLLARHSLDVLPRPITFGIHLSSIER
jgi:hypothetical protein